MKNKREDQVENLHIPRQHIDGLVQDGSISSALAMKILPSWTKP